MREYHSRHKEEHRSCMKSWYKNNRDEVLTKVRARRGSEPRNEQNKRYWLGKKRSIEDRKKMSEAKKGNMPWNKGKGGYTWTEARRKAQPPKKSVKMNDKEYDPNWHEIRKEIYERDNWHCRECGIKNTLLGKSKIQCHHIDYNEKNNEPTNLITLCASCHAKTNFKRNDWIEYFRSKKIS